MAKDNEKKTSGKSEKDTKKPNKFVKWFKDLKSEIKKVVWPSKKTVINNTAVVVATVVVCSAFVGALDFGLLKVMDLLYNR